MMDRNLGATNYTEGWVETLGLLYQWGRKDPFLGSSSLSAAREAKSTITWPSPVASVENTGTVEYAVEHPTTFIQNRSYDRADRCYTPDDNLWASDKTIYDPCPPGYKLPDSDIWGTAFGSSGTIQETYDDKRHGYDFGVNSDCLKKLTNSCSSCWYPSTGFRNEYGELKSTGEFSKYWSSTPISQYSAVIYMASDGRINTKTFEERTCAHPVRCMKEN